MDATNNTETTDSTPAPVKSSKPRKASKKTAKKPAAKKTTPGAHRLTKAEIKAANPSGKCLCGCGAEVPRRFLQGHDAQLHSKVLEAFKAEKTVRVSKTTADYLKSAPWMTKELAKIIR